MTKKAGLPTGTKGFTLVETLLAVSILAGGVVFIMPAFFKAGSVLNQLNHRYAAERLLSNLFAEKEEELAKFGVLDSRALKGHVSSFDTTYFYELETFSLTKSDNLYRITGSIRWDDTKTNRILRKAYIIH